MKLMKLLMVCIVLSLFGSTLYSQTEQEQLFMQIRKAWEAGDYRSMQPIFSKEVTLHLGQVRGHYPREQVLGILKAYFAEREAIKVVYDVKKMTETRAVANYEYRLKETGILYKKLIYFYLSKGTNGDPALWLITTINEI
jgi:hypothetical protein